MTKKCRFSYLLVAIFSTFAGIFYPAHVFAENEQTTLDLISQNCSSIKTGLRRLQVNDSRNRVDLGAYYEYLASKMMLNLNLRLVKNNLSASDFSAQQSDFNSEREAFKENFIKYSQDLEALIAIDCKDSPKDFKSQLDKTRTKRKAVAENITKINEILESHEESLDKLYQDLKK